MVAVLTLIRDTSTGLILVTIFLVPNAVGYLLWRTQKLSCYASMQIQISLTAGFGALAICILEKNNQWAEIQTDNFVSTTYAYGMIILVTAILMMVFYLRFGRN